MPEYVLWRKGDWGPYSNGYARFPEKDITAAVQKACEMIESWAKVLTEETRFVLEEVKFVPLPSDKWIINYNKKEPKIAPGPTVTTDADRDRNHI